MRRKVLLKENVRPLCFPQYFGFTVIVLLVSYFLFYVCVNLPVVYIADLSFSACSSMDGTIHSLVTSACIILILVLSNGMYLSAPFGSPNGFLFD